MAPSSSSSSPGLPWQLYLFSFIHLLVFFLIFFDTCSLLTGSDEKCNTAEHLAALSMSIAFTYVGVFFGLLTFLNKQNAAKLKRLAMFATDCSAALFAAVIMVGSTKMGGIERSSFHIADMVTVFVLFLIMHGATHGDSPANPSHNIKEDLGFNPKGLILLVLILVTIKLFVLSDFMTFSFILGDPDAGTDLSRVFMGLTVVVMFEILLGTAFTLYYGDAKDQEAITIALASMIVVTALYMIPVWGHLRTGLMISGIVSLVVFIALCITAVVLGRKHQRAGYEEVSA
jgi:hypothetical protein